MHRDSVANANSRVANKLCTIAVDYLGIFSLGRVGIVVTEGHVVHVGPFFQLLA